MKETPIIYNWLIDVLRGGNKIYVKKIQHCAEEKLISSEHTTELKWNECKKKPKNKKPQKVQLGTLSKNLTPQQINKKFKNILNEMK